MRSNLARKHHCLIILSRAHSLLSKRRLNVRRHLLDHLVIRLATVMLSLLCCGVFLNGCYPERVESVKLMNEGIKLYRSGKRFAALRILERSAQRDPTNHRATFYRGLVFNELGLANQDESHFRDAVKSFEASAKVNAGDPEVFFQLGISYKSLEKYRDALRAFEQASEIQPHA